MRDTRTHVTQILVILFVLISLVLACYFTAQIAQAIYSPTPTPAPTGTPTLTPTPTPTLPNTNSFAVTKIDAICRSGADVAYQELTMIPQFQQVMALGKNGLGNWFLIRWAKFGTDCWVKASELAYDFDMARLPRLDTPPPPTFTPTSTPTPTEVISIINPTRDSQRDEESENASVSMTNTSVQPTKIPDSLPTGTSVPPPTKSPVPPSTDTSAPRPTNTLVPPPAHTPDYPHKECNDEKDNDNDGLKDLDDPQCDNRGDDSEGQ